MEFLEINDNMNQNGMIYESKLLKNCIFTHKMYVINIFKCFVWTLIIVGFTCYYLLNTRSSISRR